MPVAANLTAAETAIRSVGAGGLGMDGDHRLKRELTRQYLATRPIANPDRFDRLRAANRLDQCTHGETGEGNKSVGSDIVAIVGLVSGTGDWYAYQAGRPRFSLSRLDAKAHR